MDNIVLIIIVICTTALLVGTLFFSPNDFEGLTCTIAYCFFIGFFLNKLMDF